VKREVSSNQFGIRGTKTCLLIGPHNGEKVTQLCNSNKRWTRYSWLVLLVYLCMHVQHSAAQLFYTCLILSSAICRHFEIVLTRLRVT